MFLGVYLVFLPDTDPIATGRRLRQEQAATEALDLFLFDSELPRAVKEDAIVELTTLFPEVEKRLARVLFARPLPRQADTEGGLGITSRTGDERVLTFVKTLLDSQPCIRQVDESWKSIPDADFSTAAVLLGTGLSWLENCACNGLTVFG